MEREPDDRLDVHNVAVDTSAANAHLCGMTDLRTGRTCVAPVHHDGTCQWVSKDEARHVTPARPQPEH
jgi:hypothetical protein